MQWKAENERRAIRRQIRSGEECTSSNKKAVDRKTHQAAKGLKAERDRKEGKQIKGGQRKENFTKRNTQKSKEKLTERVKKPVNPPHAL